MTLSLLLLIPLLGSVIALFVPEKAVKPLALVITIVTLIAAIPLLIYFDTSISGFQFLEERYWIPTFGINYIVAVDGLSLPLVILTVLLSLICIIASWNIEKHVRGYFSLFLLLQSAMTGVFIALDMFLFYVFWELMLLPMYFLIGIWGAPPRVDADGRTRGGPYAAIKFFIYTLIGSLLMLVAILWLWNQNGTFDFRQWTDPDRNIQFQVILWTLFFIAFAIKIPMFPFHTWLPDAHVEAPTAVSVVLAGVLLKMGTYGIIRFNYFLFPDATVMMAITVGVFGVINIIYGTLCAMAQTDMKRLVAYSSISHMGYVMLGMSAFMSVGRGSAVYEGLLGCTLQMWNHGTITAMMFLLVGVIYDRAHHRDITRLGGLAITMPIYTGFVGLAFFASLGLPGLSGFIGEALVLLGTWKAAGIYRIFVGIAAVGIVITAGYHLWLIHRAFLGKENPECAKLPDINLREIITLVPLGLIVIWIGVYPAPALRYISATMQSIVDNILQAGL